MVSRRKRKQTVYGATAGPILFIGLYFYFSAGSTNIYIFLAILFTAVIAGTITSSYVPDMRKKENRGKNVYSGLPKNTKPKFK
jgi:restriction system protein